MTDDITLRKGADPAVVGDLVVFDGTSVGVARTVSAEGIVKRVTYWNGQRWMRCGLQGMRWTVSPAQLTHSPELLARSAPDFETTEAAREWLLGFKRET